MMLMGSPGIDDEGEANGGEEGRKRERPSFAVGQRSSPQQPLLASAPASDKAHVPSWSSDDARATGNGSWLDPSAEGCS